MKLYRAQSQQGYLEPVGSGFDLCREKRAVAFFVNNHEAVEYQQFMDFYGYEPVDIEAIEVDISPKLFDGLIEAVG